MIHSLIVRASSGALAIAFLSSPIGASTIGTPANRSGQRAPMATPSSRPSTVQRYLVTPNGTIPLTSPAGCWGAPDRIASSEAAYQTGPVVRFRYRQRHGQRSMRSILTGGSGTDVSSADIDGDLSYNAVILTGEYNGITGPRRSSVEDGINLISKPTERHVLQRESLRDHSRAHNTIEAPQSFIGVGEQNTIVSPSFVAMNPVD